MSVGGNEAKAANADIGLRKPKLQPVLGTQPVRRTGGAHALCPLPMEVLQKTEAEVEIETPPVNTRTSEGDCKT